MARFPKSGLVDLIAAAEQFAEAHPAIAGHLGASSMDETSERAREGLFYLFATVSDVLEDLRGRDGHQALAEVVAPSLMRPFPAATIVEFGVDEGGERVPAGTEVSRDGVRFRLVDDVHVGAYRAQALRAAQTPDGLHAVSFELVATGKDPLGRVVGEDLQIYLDGPREATLLATAHLLSHAVRAEISMPGTSERRSLGAACPSAVSADRSIAPEPDAPFTGVDILREYFLQPERHCFVRFPDLASALTDFQGREATVTIVLDTPWPARASFGAKGITFRLHCAPATNLFQESSEPRTVGPESATFAVRVAGYPREGAGVYAVLGAMAVPEDGSGDAVAIPPRRRFAAGDYTSAFPYAFEVRGVAGPRTGNAETVVTLTMPRGQKPMLKPHVVWLDLLATNKDEACRLRPGDALTCHHAASERLRARTLSAPSPYVPPLAGDDLDLRTLVRGSIPGEDPRFALQSSLFAVIPRVGSDARVRADEARVDAIEAVEIEVVKDGDRRGYLARLRIDDRHFAGPGDVALFLRLLHVMFEAQVSVNSFYRCEAICLHEGTHIVWPPERSATATRGSSASDASPQDMLSRPSPLSGDAGGGDPRSLLEYAERNGPRFRFFHLLRFLEHALQMAAENSTEARQENIFCETLPDLTFPSSDVVWVDTQRERNIAHVGVSFLGLLGTNSPLSPDWSEDVLLWDEHGALLEFYNVFHHRALMALYEGWKGGVLEGGFDLDGADEPSHRLRALAGVDAWAHHDDSALPSMTAIGLGDHQRGHPHTIDAESAEKIFRRLHPEWNVRLETNVRRFVPFNPSDRARVGRETRLGTGAVFGDGRHDRQGLVRIHVGPVDFSTYEALMPGGPVYSKFSHLAERIFASTVDIELDVHLRPGEAPRAGVGSGAGSRLGIDTRCADGGRGAVQVRVPLCPQAARARRQFIQERSVQGER